MRISLALYCSLIMFLLFFSLPSPVSSENQESTAQTTTTSWRRSLAQHGDSLRVFIRRRGGGGGGRGRSSRRPVPTGGGGGSSATTRPSLSITFGLGSTVASLMLLMKIQNSSWLVYETVNFNRKQTNSFEPNIGPNNIRFHDLNTCNGKTRRRHVQATSPRSSPNHPRVAIFHRIHRHAKSTPVNSPAIHRSHRLPPESSREHEPPSSIPTSDFSTKPNRAFFHRKPPGCQPQPPKQTHLQRLYWTYWASSATPPSFKEHPSIKIEISSKPVNKTNTTPKSDDSTKKVAKPPKSKLATPHRRDYHVPEAMLQVRKEEDMREPPRVLFLSQRL
ncbi:hypothetical protein YC2023_000759 [Brassica napus]